jgi:hypothetical protein
MAASLKKAGEDQLFSISTGTVGPNTVKCLVETRLFVRWNFVKARVDFFIFG